MIDKILDWAEANFLKAILVAVLALVLLLCGVVYSVAHAAEVNVSWTHPTQYSDSTALALESIKETQVQYGTCTTATTPTFGTMTAEVVVPGPTNTAKFLNVTPATYCFRARTVDLLSRTSYWSTVVSKVIVEIRPKAPTTVVVQ